MVSPYPVGIDIERRFTPALAAELESSIINAAEKPLLAASGLPFELALTLAFSAKESGFKALPLPRQPGMDFLRMRITSIKEGMLRMQIDDESVEVHWLQSDARVITLCGKRKWRHPRGRPHGFLALRLAQRSGQRRDRRRIETVVLTKPAAVRRRRVLAVRDPQALQGNAGTAFGQHFGNQAAKSAIDVVLFNRDDRAAACSAASSA